MRSLLKKSLALAALAVCGVAQASVLSFETPTNSPFIFDRDEIQQGDFWVLSSSGGTNTGGWVGSIVDGSDTTACTNGLLCPSNNTSHYLAAFDDTFIIFGRNDEKNFKLKSFDVSFMGFSGLTYPAVSGLLILDGFDINGNLVASSSQIAVSGPNGGKFSFASKSVDAATFGSAFANSEFSFVRILSYACNAAGSCSRSGNQANFAYDNITDNIAAVPEPGTWGLMALGLVGLGALARRRSV